MLSKEPNVLRRDKPVLGELLASLASSKGTWRNKTLTAFAALGDTRSPKDMMVIGRAVNSWDNKWFADDLKVLETRQEILEKAFVPTTWHSGNPMLWVSKRWESKAGHNTRRSPFWRVIRSSIRDLDIADVSDPAWPSSICWSNLYKIAPALGGNPEPTLRKTQLEWCIKILDAEISQWEPSRILFLTGLGYAGPFINGLGWKLKIDSNAGLLEATGVTPSGTPFVVAPHPQGRPEGTLINLIVEAFNSG